MEAWETFVKDQTLLTAAVAAVCFAGALGDQLRADVAVRSDVVIEWNDRFLQTIRETGGSFTGAPGPISRAGAILHVAIYDAVNSIARTHEPYMLLGDPPPGTSMEAAVAAAAHTALSAVYTNPVQRAKFDALLEAQLGQIPDGPGKSAGIALGIACAEACLVGRADDGATDFVTYVPGDQPGDWVPTFPDFSAPITPHWPNVTPWAMTSGDQFRPTTGPYGYTDIASVLASPEYAADFEDVRLNGALLSTTRTEDETLAAIFWANDRNTTFKPPGHLFHITQVIAEGQGNTLEENARLFALVAIGMADASIAAWDSKYAAGFDLWRPITGIWNADTDGNPETIADPSWLGLSYDPGVLVFNPAFPAWVSGHSTFGAAHAAVVRNFYGTDEITFTVTSDDTPGYWRTFHSLEDAARENGRSRIWLGVHWQVDADDGYLIGTAVGDHVTSNLLLPKGEILGDLNGDGIVDGADLGILLGNWGRRGGLGDLNGDGVVDGADLGILLGNWS